MLVYTNIPINNYFKRLCSKYVSADVLEYKDDESYLDDEGVGEGGQDVEHRQAVGRHVVRAVARAHSEI